MTTLKGVMRSYNASVKRANRAQQQHNREAARRFKLQEKAEQMQNAVIAESDWRSYVKVLKSIHTDYSEDVHWDSVLSSEKPQEPGKEYKNEESAKLNLDIFKPSFFDKLFGLTEKKVSRLNELLNQAKKRDETIHQAKLKTFSTELEDWCKLKSIATGVKNREIQAYADALEFFGPFDDIAKLGKHLRFNLNEDYIDIELDSVAHGIIPTFELSLTSTGKLSRKEMSASKFNDLYFEHICSCVVRIAKEISIFLPVDYIVLTVLSKDIDKATGHNANTAILSLLIVTDKIKKLNLSTIQPSETVKSFAHNLKFTKTNGFSPVPKIDIKNNLLS